MSNECPSVYLQEKCATLSAVLDFFMQGMPHYSINEKKLTFFAQIDFWEWELETVPWVDLNRLIDKWNALLEGCEKKLLDNSINPDCGADVQPDLSKYKKKRKIVSA